MILKVKSYLDIKKEIFEKMPNPEEMNTKVFEKLDEAFNERISQLKKYHEDFKEELKISLKLKFIEEEKKKFEEENQFLNESLDIFSSDEGVGNKKLILEKINKLELERKEQMIINVANISKGIEKKINDFVQSDLQVSVDKEIYINCLKNFQYEYLEVRCCDHKKPILIFVKNEFNKTFGGFVDHAFASLNNEWKSCERAFLFSVDRKFVSRVKDVSLAILCRKDYGPIFGGGCDLYISSNCNCNYQSGTNFGKSYTLPNGINYKTPESWAFLSGTNNAEWFKVLDYEAWECVNKDF